MRVYIDIDLNRPWFYLCIFSFSSPFSLFFVLLGLSSLYPWPKVNIIVFRHVICVFTKKSSPPDHCRSTVHVRVLKKKKKRKNHVPLRATSAHSPSIPETLEKWKRIEGAPSGTARVVVGMGGNHQGLKKPKINQGFCYVLFRFYYGAHGSNNTFIEREGNNKGLSRPCFLVILPVRRETPGHISRRQVRSA